MDLAAYLQRINYAGSKEPSADKLRALQVAHLHTVPFENLDIGLGRPIQLSTQALFDKIVAQRRGGFCYELNGLFAWLLGEFGFQVTYLSARDVQPDGQLGPEYDHLTLLVQCRGQATRWLVDVGWGDSFVDPLRLDETEVQPQGLRAYRIEAVEGGRLLWQQNYDGRWERQYRFSLVPRRFPDEYEAMCRYHQTSPESHFTRSSIISRATPTGRISLDGRRLIVTTRGQRTERPVTSETEYQALLREHFEIHLDGKRPNS